jgi:hypothetical protein
LINPILFYYNIKKNKGLLMPKTTTRSPAQRAAWQKLSPWLRKQLKSTPLAQWARRIRREFNYACPRCGKKRNLEAHHIFPKHEHPKMREDLDNGILLCLKCHDEIHAILSKVPEEYYEEVSRLNLKREPMSSITKKKRNPSGAKYKTYNDKVPEGAVNEPPEPKATVKKNRGKTTSKTRKKTEEKPKRSRSGVVKPS